MKNFKTIFLLLIVSCNPWVESSKEEIFKQTSIGVFIDESNKVINARHNIDRSTIEFDVLDFDQSSFDQVVENSNTLGFCKSITNKSVFIVIQSDVSVAVETIWLSFNEKNKKLHVNVQFIPME